MVLSSEESLDVETESLNFIGRDVPLDPSAHGAETAGGAGVLGRTSAPDDDRLTEIGPVGTRGPGPEEEALELGVRIESVEETSCSEDRRRFSGRGGRGGGRVVVVFGAVWATSGRLETAVVKRGKVVGVGASTLGGSQFHEHFVNLAGLVAVFDGVEEACVVCLDLLRVAVHVLHVGLGVFKRVCEHRILRLEVLYLTHEVVVLHHETLCLLPWRSNAVGDQTFDDLLNAVAVLEGVDER